MGSYCGPSTQSANTYYTCPGESSCLNSKCKISDNSRNVGQSCGETPTEYNECRTGLECTSLNKCKLPIGSTCSVSSDCSTNNCIDINNDNNKRCVNYTLVNTPGGECGVTSNSVKECQGNMTCIDGKCKTSGVVGKGGDCGSTDISETTCSDGLTCTSGGTVGQTCTQPRVSYAGGSCQNNALYTYSCVSGTNCENGICRANLGSECENDAGCPSESVCTGDVGDVKRCKLVSNVNIAGERCEITDTTEKLCISGMSCHDSKCKIEQVVGLGSGCVGTDTNFYRCSEGLICSENADSDKSCKKVETVNTGESCRETLFSIKECSEGNTCENNLCVKDAPGTTYSNAETSSKSGSKSGKPSGAKGTVIGAAVGGSIGGVIFVAVCIWLYIRSRRRSRE